MESYEKKSDEATADAERMADEGDRVERNIAETKRDLQSKQGDPGMSGAVPEPDEEAASEADDDDAAAPESGEEGQ